MKMIKQLTVILFVILLQSCTNHEDNIDNNIVDDVNKELIIGTIFNLDATQEGGQDAEASGSYTKFSFKNGAVTTSDIEWDIAFRGTTILVNGGEKYNDDEPERNGNTAAYIVVESFDKVIDIEDNKFNADASAGLTIPTGSNNGWYLYDSVNHIITPIAGRVLVFKTYDDKYAKVEIYSYYKDAPNEPTINSESGYYTFKYTYQPNAVLNF